MQWFSYAAVLGNLSGFTYSQSAADMLKVSQNELHPSEHQHQHQAELFKCVMNSVCGATHLVIIVGDFWSH